MKAVFLDWDTLDRGDLDPGALAAVVDELALYPSTHPPQLAAHLDAADIVISNKVMLDAQTLAKASHVQLICIAATGTNNVDLDAASRAQIPVCNVRAYGTNSVVQHVFGLMIALHNRLLDYHAAVQRGDWQRSPQFCLLDYPIAEIAGKTLGIVGYGELGQAVARVARAFDMQVLIAQRDDGDTRAGRLPLVELLPQVDILSLHCPLTEANRGLIGAEQLALMRPSALLINTARGGLVDERALAEVLKQQRLAGAALDVLAEEPPAADSPLLQAPLPNLIITPHIAWASRESRQRMVQQLADNIVSFRRGNLHNRVGQ